MIKVTKIIFLENFKIQCFFNNGEQGILNLKSSLKDKYREKILNEKNFKTAKVGVFGEIYWENLAKIKELDGSFKFCNYDMSGEFVYSYVKKLSIKM